VNNLKMDSYLLSKPMPKTNIFKLKEVLDNININARVKTVKPPLIFIATVHNFQLFSQLLQEISINGYEIKITNNKLKFSPKVSLLMST